MQLRWQMWLKCVGNDKKKWFKYFWGFFSVSEGFDVSHQLGNVAHVLPTGSRLQPATRLPATQRGEAEVVQRMHRGIRTSQHRRVQTGVQRSVLKKNIFCLFYKKNTVLFSQKIYFLTKIPQYWRNFRIDFLKRPKMVLLFWKKLYLDLWAVGRASQ